MKIIHTADVHLGAAPDTGYPWEAERSASLWSVFKRLIDRVRDENADMLVISGDLFHHTPANEELKEVNYLFASIPETKVVLCAGNHDHAYGESEPYENFAWSYNVTGLWSRSLSSVSIPELDTRVYGLSYYDNEAKEDLYAGARCIGDEKYHILLLHGGDAKHSPVKKDALAAMDFDYIAMGHIHKGGYVIKNKAAYCGALTPIDKNDTGEHGYLSVDLSEDGVMAKFIPFSPYKYDSLTVYCDEEDSAYSLEEKIRSAVSEAGIQNSYRLVIKGTGTAAALLRINSLWKFGHILEIVNQTKAPYDMDALCEKYPGSVLEEYIRTLRGRDDDAGRYALKQGVRTILEAMGEA